LFLPGKTNYSPARAFVQKIAGKIIKKHLYYLTKRNLWLYIRYRFFEILTDLFPAFII
jgi:hypothetical protein